MNDVLPWIIFSLDGRYFAVNSCLVSGINQTLPITPVPEAPELFSGVCDVRGETIPVFSMRRLLKLPLDESRENMIITLSRTEGEQTPCMGFLVDEVLSVDSVELIDRRSNTKCLFISGYVFGIARSEKIEGDIMVIDEESLLKLCDDFDSSVSGD